MHSLIFVLQSKFAQIFSIIYDQSKFQSDMRKKIKTNTIMNIENGTIDPLVFSISESVDKKYNMSHKHMFYKIANKTGEKYVHC